jgi:glycosyltransferase involved in cell wall biosynthesis
LAAGFAARGYQVTVLTFAPAATDFFRLPANVSRAFLEGGVQPTPLLRLLPSALGKWARLRRALRATRPDVIIANATQSNVKTLLALAGLPYPVVVTEHGDVPTRQDKGSVWMWHKWLWYRLRRVVYPAAFQLVSVSRAVEQGFAWLPARRRRVIYNPFPPIERRETPLPAGVMPGHHLVVGVGRLAYDKGFDILIRAFARIAARHPDWQMLIIGDGERGGELRRLAAHLGLGRQVVFAGAVAEPFSLLQQADLFAMGSRYEGFPMAHGEALACGLPVVATDCPSRPARGGGKYAPIPSGGVRELVRHGIDGWLVPPEDPAALADALETVMASRALRRRLARRAPEVLKRFSSSRALDAWEALIARALAASRGRRPGLRPMNPLLPEATQPSGGPRPAAQEKPFRPAYTARLRNWRTMCRAP